MSERFPPHEGTMKGAGATRRPPPSIRLSGRSGIAVDVFLGLADLPLTLSFHLASLALELLAGVTGQSANRVADLAADFLRRTLGLVLEPIRAEIVCHDCKSSLRWKIVLGPTVKASDMPTSSTCKDTTQRYIFWPTIYLAARQRRCSMFGHDCFDRHSPPGARGKWGWDAS